MPILRFERSKTPGLLRTVEVRVAGDVVVRLKAGDRADCEVPVGSHVVTAQLGRYKSEPLEVVVNGQHESQTFRVQIAGGGPLGRWLTSAFDTAGRYPLVAIERASG